MPRDINGNYTLPAGNPVEPGTIIEADWANPTMDDVADALTDSLSRNGFGGMLVPFENADGTEAAPGQTWANEPTSGWYRAGSQDFRFSVGGNDVFIVTADGIELASGMEATNLLSFTRIDDDEPSDPPMRNGENWFQSDDGGLYMRYQNPDLTYTWILVNGVEYEAPAGELPAGVIMPYAGSSAPAGWALCDGSALSTTTYADLFDAIGYTYGGAGASFNLPDLRGRVIAGRDNMGGVAASRLTAAGSGITGTTLGASGGGESVVLATANLPSHSHSVSISDPGHFHAITDPTHTHAMADSASPATASGSQGSAPGGGAIALGYSSIAASGTGISVNTVTTGITGSGGATGSGTAHQNTQPTMVMNYIIKV